MGKDVVDEFYEQICEKLGFIPSEYKSEPSGYEDDSKPNPFSVLTVEEILYLYENGYLGEPVTKKINKDDYD